MRLLLVEDDNMLARGIATALAQSNYEVTATGTADQALRLARDSRFDIGILDLGLPDRDGLELLRAIREQGSSFPILILSARDGIDDRIRGLDVGGDDYLVKPFALRELEARLRALLRRASEEPGTVQLGSLRYDIAARRALVGGSEIELTARELSLLEALMKQSRKIISKQALFDAVFSYETDVATNALEVQISRLRQKLKLAGVSIRSLRGLGYRIEEVPDGGGKTP